MPVRSSYGENGDDTNAYDEDGNITDWGITFEKNITEKEDYISMNWGDDGNYDKKFFNPGYNWIIGNFDFTSNPAKKRIYLRTNVQ